MRIIFETLLLPDLVYYTDFDVGSGFCNLLRFSYLMLQESVTRINFKEISTDVPYFLTIFMMPFTFNIATGLRFGVISFVILKVLSGKRQEITLTMAIIALVFLAVLLTN